MGGTFSSANQAAAGLASMNRTLRRQFVTEGAAKARTVSAETQAKRAACRPEPSGCPYTSDGMTRVQKDYTVSSLPGYSGYVPAKYSETIVGATFQRANEIAAECRQAAKEKDSSQAYSIADVYPYKLSLPKKDRLDTYLTRSIPGYSGYIPQGVEAIGSGFSKKQKIAQELYCEQVDRILAERGEKGEAGDADA
mmetsp:Transcript_2679/g.6080  ORF Transcript_2679/g.6080 Transcript_2679/m.6080 type:complete len:195 (-) Transcript_2679:103-687(-)